ncbi:PRC and DUF2382 domain-containing protein [Actinomadura fulvescens]|uniref:PRC and DUF2382 domain-containing protein n=1 Tax=Actinomadura fulvescens TaxID=46160 RepID=A0ABP6CYD7_9ACTN
MAESGQVDQLHGRTVIDPDGQKIGRINQVWVDDHTGAPMWATVHTGLFGAKETFVPIRQGRPAAGGELQVPVSKDRVKDAPRVDPENGHIDERQQDALNHYYGMDVAPNRGDQAGRQAAAQDTQRERDQRVHGQDSVTRSEEHLNVGTERVETGHVRLRKVVVTEQQQVSVPVSHEEVRVVREPISPEDRRRGDQRIGEEELEVTLHGERPVVETETVPVERVGLDTETVTEEQKVGGQVRKERIEVEDDSQAGRTPADQERRRPGPGAGR